jgi:hypothetical protein
MALPNLYGIAYGNGRYVAGGTQGALIRSSADGLDWHDGLTATGSEQIFGLTYAYGVFVGVGMSGITQGYILTSANGTDWATQNVPATNALVAVSAAIGAGCAGWADPLFVAVGNRGTIITSPNGIDWVARNSGTTVALRAVAFHQGRFIVGGDGGMVLISSDGAAWVAGAPISSDVRGLASSGDGIVAVGNYSSSGRLQVSTDGLTWPGNSLEFAQGLNAITYGSGFFVAVGDLGLILQSESPTAAAVNDWTKSTSGDWEEAYWSLGQLPARCQGLVAFRNPGWKTLAVGAATTANYSNALSIESLIVAAPENSFNQLLLNYAGLNVPLSIASEFSLGPNASLVSYSSRLDAGTLLLSSPAAFSSQSVPSLGSIVVGDAAPGELNIADASIRASAVIAGRGAPGTVNQSGGTNQVDAKLSINGQSIYNLTNGYLQAGTLFLGEENRPGWTGQRYAWGGSTTVTGSVRMGTSPEFAADARGELALTGGYFQAPALEFENGIFTQIGGTNRIPTINMPSPGGFGCADYRLAGGVLLSQLLLLGSEPLGYFVQSGGVYTNQSRRFASGKLLSPDFSHWRNRARTAARAQRGSFARRPGPVLDRRLPIVQRPLRHRPVHPRLWRLKPLHQFLGPQGFFLLPFPGRSAALGY